MKTWIWGNALLTAGLLTLACSRALTSMYPVTWGGPNIGAGLLILLAGAAIAVGAGLVVATVIADRRRRSESRTAGTAVRSPTKWWLPAALSAAAAVVCAVVIIDPPGPGGSGRVGAVGVTVDGSGPVLVVVVCERSIDTVTLVGPNRGSEPNENYATLSAPAGGLDEVTLLPLNNLPPGWAGGPVSLPLQQRPSDPVIASGQGDQSYLSQVAFTAADLNALSSSEVLLTGPGTVALENVSSIVCETQKPG